MKEIGFYEAAAQIIPVLLIVIAVDHGVFATAKNRWQAVANYAKGLPIAAGEIVALLVLGGTVEPRLFWSIPIWAALAIETYIIWRLARARVEAA